VLRPSEARRDARGAFEALRAELTFQSTGEVQLDRIVGVLSERRAMIGERFEDRAGPRSPWCRADGAARPNRWMHAPRAAARSERVRVRSGLLLRPHARASSKAAEASAEIGSTTASGAKVLQPAAATASASAASAGGNRSLSVALERGLRSFMQCGS
jgi:hypothetical protein